MVLKAHHLRPAPGAKKAKTRKVEAKAPRERLLVVVVKELGLEM